MHLTIRRSEDADTVKGIPDFILDSANDAYVRGQSGAALRRTVIMG